MRNSLTDCTELDGAYFGTTFCHLFFMTFEDLVPPPLATSRGDSDKYVPKVFGFKIHHTSKSLPKGRASSTYTATD